MAYLPDNQYTVPVFYSTAPEETAWTVNDFLPTLGLQDVQCEINDHILVMKSGLHRHLLPACQHMLVIRHLGIDAEANLGRLCSLLNVAALLAVDPCLTTDEQQESTAPGLMDSFEEAKRLIGIMKDEGIEPAENTVETRTLARAIAEGKDMTSVVDAAMDKYVDLGLSENRVYSQ